MLSPAKSFRAVLLLSRAALADTVRVAPIADYEAALAAIGKEAEMRVGALDLGVYSDGLARATLAAKQSRIALNTGIRASPVDERRARPCPDVRVAPALAG